MKKVHSSVVIAPDKSKVKKFLIPPVLFSLLACFLVITFAGFSLSGIIAAIVIVLCVCLPFAILILPTFLLEKIIIESFTVTFYFVFIFFKFKKVLQLEDILMIKEQYRNQQKGKQREIVIETKKEHVLISEAKYKHDDILQLIYTLQQRNENITVNLLN